MRNMIHQSQLVRMPRDVEGKNRLMWSKRAKGSETQKNEQDGGVKAAKRVDD